MDSVKKGGSDSRLETLPHAAERQALLQDGSDSECSKTSHDISECEEIDVNEGGEEKESGRVKNGASSSNSTVEETTSSNHDQKKPSVRPYVRSKVPRLRWTPELHLSFVKAVERLGGQDRATPKLVLQHMNVNGLSIAHVKSHLQMYRSKKIEDPAQDCRHLVESGDPNIYNLSQLIMLHGYNKQRHESSLFRYGDTSWSARDRHRPMCEIRTQPTSSSWFNSHVHTPKTWRYRSTVQNCSATEANSRVGSAICRTPATQFYPIGRDHIDISASIVSPNNQTNNTQQDNKSKINLHEVTAMKRKAMDTNNDVLDLNLSLKLPTKYDVSEVESELSLSLNSHSSCCSSKHSRFKRDYDCNINNSDNESVKKASTLDLTI